VGTRPSAQIGPNLVHVQRRCTAGSHFPSGRIQGLSQFVISVAIGCGPGPMLGSLARRLGSGKPAILAAAENLGPFGLLHLLHPTSLLYAVLPSPYRTMSLGSCLLPCEGGKGARAGDSHLRHVMRNGGGWERGAEEDKRGRPCEVDGR
jgi:hypothetical protein